MTEPISAVEATPVAQTNSDDQVRTLASTLAQVQGTAVSIHKGKVTAFNLAGTPPDLSVQLSGDAAATVGNVRMIDSYSPTVNDNCLIIKQGSDIFALGQINDSNEGNSANGWVTPTLGSSFSHDAALMGDLKYRVIVDNGDRKVQFKGSVNVLNSSSATLFTLPAGAIPSAMKNIPVVRNYDGGSNVAVLEINLSGVVSLRGGTTVPTSSNENPGTNNAGDHFHDDNDGGPFTSTNGSHFHTVNNHNHPNTVSYPTWLSLNGVEVFL